MSYSTSQFRDGSVVIHCGDKGMETDLVFAEGYTNGDPKLDEQIKLANRIADVMNNSDDDSASIAPHEGQPAEAATAIPPPGLDQMNAALRAYAMIGGVFVMPGEGKEHELAMRAAISAVNGVQQYEAMVEALNAIQAYSAEFTGKDDIDGSVALINRVATRALNLPAAPKDKPQPSEKPTCEDCGASDCTLHHLCGTCVAK